MLIDRIINYSVSYLLAAVFVSQVIYCFAEPVVSTDQKRFKNRSTAVHRQISTLNARMNNFSGGSAVNYSTATIKRKGVVKVDGKSIQSDALGTLRQHSLNNEYLIMFDDAIAFWTWFIDYPAATSIWDNPVLAYAKSLHDTYGATILFNCFWSTVPEASPYVIRQAWRSPTVTMADVPDTWKAQFEEASDWLKFSAHAFDVTTLYQSTEMETYLASIGFTAFTNTRASRATPATAANNIFIADAADQFGMYSSIRGAVRAKFGVDSWKDGYLIPHRGPSHQAAVEAIRDTYWGGKGVWPVIDYEDSDRSFWHHLYGDEAVGIRDRAAFTGAWDDIDRSIIWVDIPLNPDALVVDYASLDAYLLDLSRGNQSGSPRTLISHEYMIPGGNLRGDWSTWLNGSYPTEAEATELQSWFTDFATYAVSLGRTGGTAGVEYDQLATWLNYNYRLPYATTTDAGGVSVGSNLSILGSTLSTSSTPLFTSVHLSFNNYSNSGVDLTNASNVDNIAAMAVYPSTGAASAAIQVIPRSTGYPQNVNIKAQVALYSTDIVADPVNYDAFTIRAGQDRHAIQATAVGTGTTKPIVFQQGANNVGTIHPSGGWYFGSSITTDPGAGNITASGNITGTHYGSGANLTGLAAGSPTTYYSTQFNIGGTFGSVANVYWDTDVNQFRAPEFFGIAANTTLSAVSTTATAANNKFGSLTSTYLPLWNGSALANSIVTGTATNVGINGGTEGLFHVKNGFSYFEVSAGATTNAGSASHSRRMSTGDMANGFGVYHAFQLGDNAQAAQNVGVIGFRRAGADNTADFVVSPALAGTLTEYLRITSTGDHQVNGHISYVSNTSCTASVTPYSCCTGSGTGTCQAAPTLSACGTSPTVVGNNNAGKIVIGATGTGCTVTFAASPAYTSAPSCTVGGTAAVTSSTTTTVLTLVAIAGTYSYQCFDY